MMKTLIFPMAFLAIVVFALAAQTAPTNATDSVSKPPQATEDRSWLEPQTWSITGTWTVKHPHWFDELLIYPDGTFVRTGEGRDGGKWRLSTESGHVVLHLIWTSYAPHSAAMVTSDCFRGRASGGEFELRRLATFISERPVPPSEVGFFRPFDDAALRAKLNGSTWRLKDGKRFTLHADGLTTGDWHDRRGKWRIIGPQKVQMTIWWSPTLPETVTVEEDGTLLRWSDGDSGRLAEREKANK